MQRGRQHRGPAARPRAAQSGPGASGFRTPTKSYQQKSALPTARAASLLPPYTLALRALLQAASVACGLRPTLLYACPLPTPPSRLRSRRSPLVCTPSRCSRERRRRGHPGPTTCPSLYLTSPYPLPPTHSLRRSSHLPSEFPSSRLFAPVAFLFGRRLRLSARPPHPQSTWWIQARPAWAPTPCPPQYGPQPCPRLLFLHTRRALPWRARAAAMDGRWATVRSMPGARELRPGTRNSGSASRAPTPCPTVRPSPLPKAVSLHIRALPLTRPHCSC